MSKVTKIDAVAPLPEYVALPQIMRVAAYARVSTDLTAQLDSLEAQIDYYAKKVAEHKGWVLAGIYADEGRTGTSYIHRVEFNRMIADCENGKIDMIITKSVSRFARNTVDALKHIRKLKEYGIGVFFERENIWTLDSKGEFLITLLTSLAQEEARSISENTTWGKRKRFADGKYSVGYSTFLGYDRGMEKCTFVINESQARIVRLIYRMYLQGYSFGGIADFLTSCGIKTPAHSEIWYSSVVKGILTNEKYKGDALLQKQYTVDFLTKKRRKNNGEFKQYYVENGHDAIVERQVFDYIQEQIKQDNQYKHRISKVDIYSSMFVCGNCGNWFCSRTGHSNTKYKATYLGCRTRFEVDSDCKFTIKKDKTPEILIDLVRRICKKYPSIKAACREVLYECGIERDITIKERYTEDFEELRMIMKPAIIMQDGTIKIELIDGKRTTIKV